jgi:hypothetical protein
MTHEKHTPPDSSPKHDTYTAFSNLLGKNSDIAERYLSGLQSIVQNDPGEQRIELEEFWQLQDELYARNASREITTDELLINLRALSNLRNNTARFDRTEKILHSYDERAEIQGITENVEDIKIINDLLARAGANDNLSSQAAPLKDYLENTDDAWKYADDKTIRDYLIAKPFVDDQTLSWLQHDNAVSVTTLRQGISDKSKHFDVPTRLVVSAAGFGSWLGRDDSYGNQGMGEKDVSLPNFTSSARRTLSLHAIKAYASHPSPLPPVTEAAVYIQPNGLVYAGNASGDSHRIAAAVLRGQETIAATSLSAVLLKDNYFK